MTRMHNVLIVEDNHDHRGLLEMAFSGDESCGLRFAGSVSEMTDAVDALAPDAMILDLGLPDSRGLGTLELALERSGGAPVVVMTAERDGAIGLEAVRMGAADFVQKADIAGAGLPMRISYAVERARARREVERANSVLQAFVASIGHDLRGPLRRIARANQAARNALCTGDSDAALAALADIDRHVVRERALLDASLEFARHASTRPVLEWVNIGAIARRVRGDLAHEDASRVTIAAEVSAWADPHLMDVTLRNLVGNGLKFWKTTPSRVRIEARRSHGVVHVAVSDTGMGMCMTSAEAVLRPGQRGANVSDIPGTGFGLSIVHSITALQGGRMQISSRIGSGTRVRIDLPDRVGAEQSIAQVVNA